MASMSDVSPCWANMNSPGTSVKAEWRVVRRERRGSRTIAWGRRGLVCVEGLDKEERERKCYLAVVEEKIEGEDADFYFYIFDFDVFAFACH